MLLRRVLYAYATVVAAVGGPLCRRLRDRGAATNAYFLGERRNVSVLWSEPGPSLLAAALLAAVFRHGLRYDSVQLRRSPGDLCDLQLTLCRQERTPQQIQFTVAASVRSRRVGRCDQVASNCSLWSTVTGGASWPWDARLRLVGEGVSSHAALFAHVPNALGNRAACLQLQSSHHFYANTSLLWLCNFLQVSEERLRNFTSTTNRNKYCGGNSTCLSVLVPREHKRIGTSLLELAEANHVPLSWAELREDALSRRPLLRLLNSFNQSFLFVDYDYWKDRPDVYHAFLPSPFVSDFRSVFDRGASFRVADVDLFSQRAPPLYDAICRFRPDAADLREIVELEAQHDDIEEAVCDWALRNVTRFKRFFETDRLKFETKIILVFLCRNETFPNNDHSKVVEIFNVTVGQVSYSDYKLMRQFTDCSDGRDLENRISKFKNTYKWSSVAGVVAAGEGGAGAASAAFSDRFVLILYDGLQSALADAGAGVYATGGSNADLWLAHKYFFRLCGWKRLVVLAERSLVGDLSDEISPSRVEEELVTRKVYLSGNRATEHLKSLQASNARVFLLNGNISFARSILCAAAGLGMTKRAEYAWIVRDRPTDIACENASTSSLDIAYFTISYWRSDGARDEMVGVEEADAVSSLRGALDAWRGNSAWPRLAAPLLDALLLLLRTHSALLRRHPQYTFELHGETVLRDFAETLRDTMVEGVSQRLRYKRNFVEDPKVYVDEWRGGRRDAIAVWQVADGCVRPLRTMRAPYADGAPPDGGNRCLTTRSGDPFAPRCHDAAWALLAAACLLLPPALYAARRQRLARLAHRYRRAMAQQRAYRDDVFAELRAHLVDEEEIELREELGSGHFGRVHLAILRSPPRAPLAVAAKRPHADADEKEILKEARILASLKHESVVRFVGVCAAGDSALVLMEYAFYGDLRRYLHERRHLVETTRVDGPADDEAQHVSATALTRLARQAAAALAYLCDRRVVHRDVRAANCLVDSRRALKLADFGMARELVGRTDDLCDYTYTCRRRALFPVQTMAPESVGQGAFSSASDVWALGVLLLELVTLGARPYGEWAPERIARHVLAGGRPPLPRGATPQTRAVASLCWERAPQRRPRASQLVAYLASQPRALAPVAHSAATPDSPRHDSGFSEYAHGLD